MKIKHRILGCLVLGALAPGVVWGEAKVTDSAISQNQAALHRNDKGKQHGPTASQLHSDQASPAPAKNGASKPSRNIRGRAVAPVRNAGTQISASAVPTPTQGQQSVVTPRLSPNAARTNTVPVLSGNAVSRHTSVSAGLIGGPRAPGPGLVGGPANSTSAIKARASIDGSAVRRRL
jgi:hypothetical protein